MCGIAGIVHLDRARSVAEAPLRSMIAALRHRGPDDEGLHLDGNAGLAHTRLSILDLSPAGRQPMTTEDGALWITFNGEIYNHEELRGALEARGHRFRTRTDTEVLLRLYLERGEDCLALLNGMFAFAIWDGRARRLFAARDRLGIKPFYYVLRGGAFLFASEVKALLATGMLPAEVDSAGLADYLTFQFCLGDKTLFRGVRRLPPGCSLVLDERGPRLSRYWDLAFAIDRDHTEHYFQQELDHLIHDAVRLQLRADVPVGAHLSGGLDSSLVACAASRVSAAPLHTFTGAFREGRAYDETGYAREVAKQIASTHTEIFPGPEEFVASLPHLVRAMDEPVAGPGAFPQLCVSRTAAAHVKVVLGGQGADELFGGYVRYLVAYLEECIRGGIEGTQACGKYIVTFESILPNLPQLRGYLPLLREFWSEGLFETPSRRYFRLIDRSTRLRPIVARAVFEPDGYSPFEQYMEVFEGGECESLINRMTRFDMLTLLPALLHVEDRTSMAASLESRVPLLDHRIAELAARMPPAVKFAGGRSKHIFREVARSVVPPAVWERTDKMGFPVPLDVWLKEGPVREYVADTLTSRRARDRGLFDVRAVEGLMDGEAPFGRAVWGLLSLELWMQVFIDVHAGVASAG